MTIALTVQLHALRRVQTTRNGTPVRGNYRFVTFWFEVCPSHEAATAEDVQAFLTSGREVVGKILYLSAPTDLGDGGEKARVVLADRVCVLWPDEVRNLLNTGFRIVRQEPLPTDTPEANEVLFDSADLDLGPYTGEEDPVSEEPDPPEPEVVVQTPADEGDPDRWWDKSPRPDWRSPRTGEPRHNTAITGPRRQLGVVVCVTQPQRHGDDYPKTYPFELPIGMDLEEFDSYIARRQSVHGFRLWLEKPTAAATLGLKDCPGHERVRNIEKRVPWEVSTRSFSSVELWTRNRVVDLGTSGSRS